MSQSITLHGGACLRGSVCVPGDKSISHRSLIFNAMAEGSAKIDGLLESEDVESTATCLRNLGVRIEGNVVHGRAGRMEMATNHLHCGNSGTTIRLLMGLLAGQDFQSTLTGDASLQRRPMKRVAGPLEKMGAVFPDDMRTPPIVIKGGRLHSLRFHAPVASAQVKTALMLAALQSEGLLEYTEPSLSRDHTERMFRAMGVDFASEIGPNGLHQIRLQGPQRLTARSVTVPGDVSSAAFFLVGASILKGSDLLIQNVGVNPTRDGSIAVLRRMGANVTLENQRTSSGEPVADLRVTSSPLHGTEISGTEIPRLVDELPVIAVAAAHASGRTIVRDAAELRVKESDRIEATAEIVRSMGGSIEVFEDGFCVTGQPHGGFHGFEITADGDHRIAMASCIAGLAADGATTIHGADSINTSFPDFLTHLEKLRG